MESDKMFCVAFVAAFIVVFGTMLINDYTSGERKLKCIALVADKSATEIMAVCK